MRVFIESVQDFLSRLIGMHFSDYLDILLVAALIYVVIINVRSTVTSRIIKVVFAILVISWITEEADLHTLNFLFDQVLTVGLIALVVLFQPELRRMVEHMGAIDLKTLLGKSETVRLEETVIAQTVQACEVMSRERIGALIVFARGQRLEEYFKTGTVIDGHVSEQLIRNIFFPKAALHDGAMIVCDGKVAAAGCVLPLSENTRLSADLGTRHRAGVGMSEVTDAVVVIVSEETGTISVAVGGMLKRHLAPQTLEKLLRNELCSKEEQVQEDHLLVRLARKLKKEGKADDK